MPSTLVASRPAGGAAPKPNRDTTPSTSTSSKGRALQPLMTMDASLVCSVRKVDALTTVVGGSRSRDRATGRGGSANAVAATRRTLVCTHLRDAQPGHPARARLRGRHPAGLPLQAQGRERGPGGGRPAPAAQRPALFASRWFAIGMASPPAPGSCTSRRSRWRRCPSCRPCSPPVSSSSRCWPSACSASRSAPRQWLGVAMTAAGLLLLVFTLPAAQGAHSAYSLVGMVSFEAGMLAIGALLISGPHLGAPDHHHGIMLGAAAGMLFGVSDVAIKALTGARGPDRRADVAVARGGDRRLGRRLLRLGPRHAGRRGRARSSPPPRPPRTSRASSAASSCSATRCRPTRSGIVLQGVAFAMVVARGDRHAAAGARRGAANARARSASGPNAAAARRRTRLLA